MAIAVIGGLITSTALTLVIVPAAFTLVDDIERWLAPKFGRVLIAQPHRRRRPVRSPTRSTEGATTTARNPSSPRPMPASAPAWWVRLLSRLPLRPAVRVRRLVGWLAFRVYPLRAALVRENLARAFPSSTRRSCAPDARLLPRLRADAGGGHQVRHYGARGNPPARADRESRAAARAPRAGPPVLLVAAHQCNWEWMLLALSLELGYPLDAAYKPLVDSGRSAR